jgi:hypothetical protein
MRCITQQKCLSLTAFRQTNILGNTFLGFFVEYNNKPLGAWNGTEQHYVGAQGHGGKE